MKNAYRPVRRSYVRPPTTGIMRPSDWGFGMTVCIASLAEVNRTIVVATDQMASMATISIDHAMVKADFIGSWFAMWSGDDITPIPTILARAREILEEHGRPSFEWTAAQAGDALSRAYQEETRRRAVAEFLTPFDLDMPKFLSDGAHIFQNEYQARLQNIEHFDLGIDFLVAGFHGSDPAIFTVGRRGHVMRFNKPGFWAIGSGWAQAIGALALRRHHISRKTPEVLYAVLEAKFAAELSRGVGRDTTLAVMDPYTFIRPVPQQRLVRLRSIWENLGQPPTPTEALTSVDEWWGPQDEEIREANVAHTKAQVERISQAIRQVPRSTKRGRKDRSPSQG